MSTQPPSPVQIDYATYIPPERPTSVTVLSIIGIIFGVLGLLGTGFAFLQYFIDFTGQPNPMIDITKANGALFITMVGLQVLGFVLSIILLAGSILSLKRRAVGRQLMMTYVWFGLAQLVITVAINFFIIYPPMLQQMRGQIPPGFDGIMYGSLLVGGAVGAIYPLCVLYYFTRPHVKAALTL